MPLFDTSFKAMGGPGEIQLDAPDEATARRCFKLALDEIDRLEIKYSRYRAGSLISRINAAAGAEPVAIDEETSALLDYGGEMHRQSEGRFDLTSGVWRRVWHFGQEAARPPSDEERHALLPLVGWALVEREGLTVRLSRAGMELDLGGIGKEYAVDRCAAVLQQAGVVHALVNLAGDLRALGPKPDGGAWRVGVRDPHAPTRMLADIEMAQGALATSGDYERCLLHEGRRYGHVLDARSGQPVDHWRSVSVRAPTTLMAGSLSTLTLLMQEQGLKLLRDSGLDFLAVDAQGQVHTRS